MSYKLFLDDYRDPAFVAHLLLGSGWVIARDLATAKATVLERGCPTFISFDHDLGDQHYSNDWSDGSTGYDFAKWFCKHVSTPDNLPEDFGWYVHSMNPVGAKRIRELMQDFVRGQ